jgi:hypothetical protein
MKRFALIAIAFVALLEVGLVFQGEAQVGSTGSSIYFPPPSATSSWFRKVNLNTIKVWHYDNIYSLARIKFGPAPMSDTLRMRSDTTVALIFLRGRGDSAWAFKARKGTTTWQILLYQDTLGVLRQVVSDAAFYSGGSLYSASGYGLYGDFWADRASGGLYGCIKWLPSGGAINSHYLVLSDTTRKIYFIPGSTAGDTATGGIAMDSANGGWRIRAAAGKSLQFLGDTLKAKVVATTAMSEWSSLFTMSAFLAYGEMSMTNGFTAGCRAIGAKQNQYMFPYKKLTGSKVVIDSVVYTCTKNLNTDTSFLSPLKWDSVGHITSPIKTDTLVGPTGGLAFIRRAISWPTTDSLSLSGYIQGVSIRTGNVAGNVDTTYFHNLIWKYHTIP